MSSLYETLPIYARLRRASLNSKWPVELRDAGRDLTDSDALGEAARANGWPEARPVQGRPRAKTFPLLAQEPGQGWSIAEGWEQADTLRLIDGRQVDWRQVTLWKPPLSKTEVGGEHRKAIGVFWEVLMRRKHLLVAAFAATVMINLIALATGLYSMQIYDRVIPRAGYSTLWVLSVGVIVAILIDFGLRLSRALLLDREAAAMDVEISDYFFSRAQSVRLDARPPGVGTIAAQLKGLETVRGLLSSGSLFLIADLPFALLFIAVIWMLGGFAVAMVPLVFFPISLACAGFLALAIRRDSNRATVSGTRKNGLLVESFDAAETIKANYGGWFMRSRWNRLVDEVLGHEDTVKRWSAVAQGLFISLQSISYVLIIAAGAVEVAENRLTVGALIACSIIAGRVNGPLMAQLPGLIVRASYASSSLRMLDAVLALPVERSEAESVRPETIDPSLVLRHTRFAYPGARPSIDIDNLRIAGGERVGIVGGIGSGKTTLLRLMAGLYMPEQGSVTLGGLDIGQVDDEILRRSISYLPQDYRLINGTLRDNLVLGMADPGDAAILEAAETTGLIGLIRQHPRGLELEISEGGRGLSGGQRTLTGLTRLLLKKPALWLLDEPTANLDQATEQSVLRALRQAADQDSSFVLVTHRTSLLSLVDRALVMQQGRIAMDGPTAEVVKRLRGKSGAAGKDADAAKKPSIVVSNTA